jgi:hypothetical protein
MKTESRYKKVTSFKKFKRLASQSGGVEFFILLNGGFRSSKHASFDGKEFYIDNYIDGSSQVLDLDLKESIILEAINKGQCYMEA